MIMYTHRHLRMYTPKNYVYVAVLHWLSSCHTEQNRVEVIEPCYKHWTATFLVYELPRM